MKWEGTLQPVKRLRMEDFKQCPGKENIPVRFEDIILSQAELNIIDISGKVLISSVLGLKTLQATFEVHKCKSKEDISTCEYYTQIKMDDLCGKLNLWKEFLKNTTIPTKCPIQPGEYYVNHSIADIKSFQTLPLTSAYWKIKIFTIEDKKVKSCVNVAFSIQETMKRINVK
ncbi:uncharacterized protein LOC142323289 isoform X2 [Lycorma delicatula]|uniref:uncharacterized protein LOC142323289 isoform X2 n=1 Tax=Lycorma delicatula TaxID=130591 RepID=UPI003F5133FE